MQEALTEIGAINLMLSAIGQAPVNLLVGSTSSDVITARKILDNVSREVQMKGWHFNTDSDVILPPDVLSKEIILPVNVIRIEEAGRRVALRGQRVYDKLNKTYQFSYPITVDTVTLLDWEELPEAARLYMAIRAARQFCDNVLGAANLHTYKESDERKALQEFRQHESRAGKPNLFNNYFHWAATRRRIQR